MNLDAIGIIAADTAKSVAFYALLGVQLKQAGGAEHFEAATPSGVRIMLDSVALIRSFDPDWKKPSGSGVVLCFKQATAADVDRLYAAILAAGHHGKKSPWDAFWGQRYACVLDPDGNQIDLFAPL
jgi:catechol 2,3-dioxygenase-like lactoylglutathione lyase family enzyme